MHNDKMQRLFTGVCAKPFFAMLMLCIASSTAYAKPQFNDEFTDAASLADWQSLAATPDWTALEIKPQAAYLRLTPKALTGWYKDSQAPFLYKHLSGNFMLSTAVTVRNQDPAKPLPLAEYNSAGLLLRDASSQAGQQNWVMLNVGAQEAGRLGTETKTTRRSVSQLSIQAADVARGELRICRYGYVFAMYRKLENESAWRKLREYYRADLPTTLQAGITVNGWTEQADVTADFDYVRYEPIKNLAICGR